MNRREICLGFSCRVFRAITMKHCSLSLHPALRGRSPKHPAGEVAEGSTPHGGEPCPPSPSLHSARMKPFVLPEPGPGPDARGHPVRKATGFTSSSNLPKAPECSRPQHPGPLFSAASELLIDPCLAEGSGTTPTRFLQGGGRSVFRGAGRLVLVWPCFPAPPCLSSSRRHRVGSGCWWPLRRWK